MIHIFAAWCKAIRLNDGYRYLDLNIVVALGGQISGQDLNTRCGEGDDARLSGPNVPGTGRLEI